MTARISPLYKFKADEVAASGEFAGYASTYDPDLYGHIVAPGAFKDTLAEHKSRGTVPALLWAHRSDEPIGKWLEMRETNKGLLASGKLTLDVPRAKQAHALMKDGALSMSIGYDVPKGGFAENDDGYTVLKEIRLFEVSLVSVPANHNARVIAVKSFLDDLSVRELEAALRDGLGMSRREAAEASASLRAGIGLKGAGPDSGRLDGISDAFFREMSIEFKHLNQYMKGKQ